MAARRWPSWLLWFLPALACTTGGARAVSRKYPPPATVEPFQGFSAPGLTLFSVSEPSIPDRSGERFVAGEIAEMGYENPDDVPETLDRAEALVFEVAERRVSDSLVELRSSLQDALDHLEAMYGRDSGLTGHATGFHDLDDMIRPWPLDGV